MVLTYTMAPSPEKPSLDEQGQPSGTSMCHVPGTALSVSSASLLSSKASEVIQRWGTDPARSSFWSKVVQGVVAERDSQAPVRISDGAVAAHWIPPAQSLCSLLYPDQSRRQEMLHKHLSRG